MWVIDLLALTLAGPTRHNPVLDPLAVQHLKNRLNIFKPGQKCPNAVTNAVFSYSLIPKAALEGDVIHTAHLKGPKTYVLTILIHSF